MNYKEAVCQAAIALWASAKPGYNSDPKAAVEQGVKIADELRIKGFLDSFEKNPDPVEFHPERQLLRTKELAALLRISARSITNWRERRVIPFIKIKGVIMFDVHKVKAALERFERKEIR
jgi:Helix-turn-helix domain